MKYLILIILLSGCSSMSRHTKLYYCASIGPHGTYAHWSGEYSSLEDANQEALVIGKRLYDLKAVPTEYAECFLPEEKTL